jgi:hypothetical protein
MMRYLISLLIVLLSCSASLGAMKAPRGGGVAAVSASCPADGSPDLSFGANPDNVAEVSNNNYSGYIGARIYPSVTKQICKVGFELSLGGGSISSKTYYAEIRSESAAYTIGSAITNGTSDGVTGSNAWDHTTVYFTFATPPTISSGTYYYIIIRSTLDASNYALAWLRVTGVDSGVEHAKCDSTSNDCRQDLLTKDTTMRVYYYD